MSISRIISFLFLIWSLKNDVRKDPNPLLCLNCWCYFCRYFTGCESVNQILVQQSIFLLEEQYQYTQKASVVEQHVPVPELVHLVLEYGALPDNGPSGSSRSNTDRNQVVLNVSRMPR